MHNKSRLQQARKLRQPQGPPQQCQLQTKIKHRFCKHPHHSDVPPTIGPLVSHHLCRWRKKELRGTRPHNTCEALAETGQEAEAEAETKPEAERREGGEEAPGEAQRPADCRGQVPGKVTIPSFFKNELSFTLQTVDRTDSSKAKAKGKEPRALRSQIGNKERAESPVESDRPEHELRERAKREMLRGSYEMTGNGHKQRH